MKEKLAKYDPAEDLLGDRGIAFFLSDALETSDPAYIALAVGTVARAKGVVEIAKATGLSVEQIYRSLNDHGSHTLEAAKMLLNETTLRADSQNPQLQSAQDERIPATMTQ